MAVPRSVQVPCVLVGPEVAGEIAGVLRAALVARRSSDAVAISPATLDVVEGLEWLARMNRADRPSVVSDVVADPAPELSTGTAVVMDYGSFHGEGAEIGPAEFASLAGVSRQAILGRLKRGTLAGRQDARGRWHIAVPAVDGSAA
jgi:hypothetical protein